jgi:hypothetical protein
MAVQRVTDYPLVDDITDENATLLAVVNGELSRVPPSEMEGAVGPDWDPASAPMADDYGDEFDYVVIVRGGIAQRVSVLDYAATQAEARTATNAVKAMTPATTADVLPYPDARQAGVVIDGTTNDRLNLNTYIADCAADGRPCYLRPGTYQISGGELDGQGRMFGAGRGRTVIRQADTNRGVIDFNSRSEWEISDLTVESNASATNYRSIQVRGAGTRGAAHRVTIVNGGFYVSGGSAAFNPGTATTPGIQSLLVLDSIWSVNSDEFGISLESVQGADLIAPQVTSAAIDGIKMLHTCDDITVTGGFATLCGQEGLDSFMGGRNLTIVGFKAYDNTGNGITVKSDDNLYDPGNFQTQGQTSLIGVICRGNTGSGITIDRNGSVDDPLVPLMMHVTLQGGVFEGNTNYGIHVRARNVSLVAPLVRRNNLHGIHFDSASMDCEAISPQVQGNSLATVNTYDGIHLNGTRNRVVGGFSIGKDSDSIKNDGDYAGLTAQQRYGVIIVSGSVNCEVIGTTAFGNATGQITAGDVDGLVRTRDRWDIIDAGGTRRTLAVDSTGRLTIGGVVVGTQT